MNQSRVTPFLWFNNNAESAAEFYRQVFSSSGKPAKKGDSTATGIELELDGQRLIVFNGGPLFQFNEAISLSVACDSQEEIDYFWNALTDEGRPGRCGWLKDKFGLSWQIVPRQLSHLLRSPRATSAMMAMTKLDIKTLEEANEPDL